MLKTNNSNKKMRNNIISKKKNTTLNSDGATGTRTRVGSFEAPLDRRKSSTSKFVSAPALPSNLQNAQYSLLDD